MMKRAGVRGSDYGGQTDIRRLRGSDGTFGHSPVGFTGGYGGSDESNLLIEDNDIIMYYYI